MSARRRWDAIDPLQGSLAPPLRWLGYLAACAALGLGAGAAAQEGADPPLQRGTNGEAAGDAQETDSEDGGAGEASPAARVRADVISPVADLLAQFDCLSCHAPDSTLRRTLDPAAAPKLVGITGRVGAAWLAEFMEAPRSLRPDTVHPHQLAGIPENGRAQVVEDLVHYLHSLDRAGRRDDADPTSDGDEPVRVKPESSDIGTIEFGRALFHQVGCVVCHGPKEPIEDLELPLAALDGTVEEEDPGAAGETPDAPSRPGVLDPTFRELPPDLAQKYRPSTLADFLVDPVALRPSGHCPSMSLAPAEARAIADYLLLEAARRPDGTYERRPGLLFRAYEGDFVGPAGKSFPLLDTLTPAAIGVARGIGLDVATRDERFGLRFSGLLEVANAGTTTFFLNSDDGSRLYLDGDLVIDNGGAHGPRTRSATLELEAGLYAFQVDFYEVGGGETLALTWASGDDEPTAIPADSLSHWPLNYTRFGSAGQHPSKVRFTAEAVKVERGKRAFARLGCAICHADVRGAEAPFGASPPPSFDQLAGVRPGVLVCLRPDGRYNHSAETAGLLLSAFVDSESLIAGGEDPVKAVETKMLRRNCYGCHRREDLGGVHPTLMPFFTGDENAELGDQGRFPPTLTAVGTKLRPEVLRSALAGDVKVRPYLKTRMPKIGARNLGPLAANLEAADAGRVGVPPEVPPENCGTSTVTAGRQLAGDRGGLGCVQCHDFLGTPSLGVRAVDLGTMHERLRFEWFRQLLLEPSSVDLGSRMANVWIDGRSPIEDVEGGDVEAQIRALWCWLAEGESMAPPPGLDTGPWAYEVSPLDEVRVVGVFMKDVSPRVVCVGTPAGVHSAFDAENSRLAKAWRGRFLNAIGTWQGRAGGLEQPASSDVVDFAPGLAVLPLARLDAPWPEDGRVDGGTLPATRALGRTVSADGSVTFRYSVGQLTVEETVRPTELSFSTGTDEVALVRAGVERSFRVTAPAGGVGEPVIARVAISRQFDRVSPGKYRLDGAEWPKVSLDRASSRIAKVVRAKPLSERDSRERRSSDRPVVDGRFRRKSATRSGGGPGEPNFDELRIPVLLVPAPDGSGVLVGTFSWSYAW